MKKPKKIYAFIIPFFLLLFWGVNHMIDPNEMVVTVTVTQRDIGERNPAEDEPDPVVTVQEARNGDTIAIEKRNSDGTVRTGGTDRNSGTVRIRMISDDYVVVQFVGNGIYSWCAEDSEMKSRDTIQISYGERFVVDTGTISGFTQWALVFEK